ncbi:MAG: hypothetical protein LWW95_06000 [Candidatus Desulfofervidus auxilii]|nr:hypothetical protein [Candidatus Desulfofervidus auxilii]
MLGKLLKKIETLFEAATYAEAGAFEIAREVLKKKEKRVPIYKRPEERKEIRASRR